MRKTMGKNLYLEFTVSTDDAEQLIAETMGHKFYLAGVEFLGPYDATDRRRLALTLYATDAEGKPLQILETPNANSTTDIQPEPETQPQA